MLKVNGTVRFKNVKNSLNFQQKFELSSIFTCDQICITICKHLWQFFEQKFELSSIFTCDQICNNICKNP
jgi:hypothetical protein